MITYLYKVEMLGFIPVTGECKSSRSHDAEIMAIKHFMEVNDIEKGEGDKWSELIQFYAPYIKVKR